MTKPKKGIQPAYLPLKGHTAEDIYDMETLINPAAVLTAVSTHPAAAVIILTGLLIWKGADWLREIRKW